MLSHYDCLAIVPCRERAGVSHGSHCVAIASVLLQKNEVRKMSDKCLLILSCSQKKDSSAGTMRAFDRYHFDVLKKAQREGYFPPNLDMLILSAKYGLITPDTPIEYYDFAMTDDRARELQQSVSAELDRHLQQNDYREIFVNLGARYLIAIAKSHEIRNQSQRVLYAEGKIGIRKGAMKRWICAHNVPI